MLPGAAVRNLSADSRPLRPAACLFTTALLPLHPQACTVDGFEVPFEHEGNRLTVDVPQVGSLHAGRSAQQLSITF